MSKKHRITQLQVYPLNVPLINPFTIAVVDHRALQNVAVKITLADGSVGWGETPTLPPVTHEDQSTALIILEQLTPQLIGLDAAEWRRIAAELKAHIPEFPSIRCGIEMALLDALTRSFDVPLYQFFGGATRHVVTDITIPICEPALAETLARQYCQQGFTLIKTKIGQDIAADIERISAIRKGFPDCALLLDANMGFSAEESLTVMVELRRKHMTPVLLEQPVAREDWEGLGKVAREAGVPIAADESCRCVEDAVRIAKEGLAQVINIKLSKCGVAEALDIAAVARSHGIGLMIGAMVETRIAIGFGAHFTAGLGGFDWVDLDTSLLLAEDPVHGGFEAKGPRYQLDAAHSGHGGWLSFD